MRRSARQQQTAIPADLTQVTAAVLDEMGSIFDAYIVFPNEECRTAVILWTAHAWVYKSFDTTPRLSMRSVEPGSGKTTVLELIEHMAPNPMNSVSMTPGVLWRLMEHSQPTIILDEADTIFGRNGSSSSHSYLRGIINAGHRKGATVPRCVGSTDVKHFNVFGPIAMGGLGRLPETIATRSVEIVMRKRKEGDPEVRTFRLRFAQDALGVMRKLLEQWSGVASETLATAMPDLPVSDRKADVWEPLVSIADLAGPEWGQAAREACVLLTTEATGKPTSTGVQLLIDIKAVIGSRDQMFTSELIAGLHELEEAAWTPDNLDGRRLARVLAEYGIAPRMLRRGEKTSRGYSADAFADAFDRYVPTKETEMIES